MDCKDEASPDEIAFLAGRGQLVNAVGAIVNGKFVLRGKNCRIEEIVTDNIHQCKYGNSISNANSEVDVLNEAAFLIESGYKHENIKGYQRIMNSACVMFKSDI